MEILLSVKVIESIKLIYPEIKGGFSYWETSYSGKPWKKPIEGLVWENKEFSKPSWEQISSKFDEIELNFIKNNLCLQRKKYLDTTDKKMYEALDRGFQDYPEKEKRQLARDQIQAIKECKTIEETEKFSVEF